MASQTSMRRLFSHNRNATDTWMNSSSKVTPSIRVSAESTRASIASATVLWKEMREAPTSRVRFPWTPSPILVTYSRQNKDQALEATFGKRFGHRPAFVRMRQTRCRSPTLCTSPTRYTLRSTSPTSLQKTVRDGLSCRIHKLI